MWEFNQSLRYDKRMHAEDIQGSIAYAKALKLAGVLTTDEEHKLVQGLMQVGEEWKSGKVRLSRAKPQTQKINVICSSRSSLRMKTFTQRTRDD